MAKAQRVFELANDLGVTSKDIIAKCEAESIPGIKNHMSTVSIGLAMTIREWFTEGESATAVETAPKVDVERARAKAKKSTRKSRKKDSEVDTGADDSSVAVETEVAEPDVETETETTEVETVEARTATGRATAKAMPAAPKVAPPVEEPVKEAAPTPAEKIEEPALAPAASTEAATDTAPEKAKAKEKEKEADSEVITPAETSTAPVAEKKSVTADSESASPVMNVPNRPKEIRPVGPMLEQPTKTKLSGPKVIRVEAPDPVPSPRPRSERRTDGPMSRGGPRGGAGAGAGPMAPPDGPGGRDGGRSSRRNKRRSGAGDGGRRSAIGGESQQGFNWRQQDLVEREERLNRSGGFFRTHRRDTKGGGGPGQKSSMPGRAGGPVKVSEPIVIKDLSSATGVKAADIIKKLFLAGQRATINSVLETEQAMELMLEFGIELEVVERQTAVDKVKAAFADREMKDPRPRPPVVTILGHVDHGKTSLLDRIRKANVAAKEAGGITQATSAFRVPVKAGDADRVVVFLDTPGHEAFTEMRARGARVTDVVVLVIAADDGVMPQTVESINHAKAAGVPIVVALNKVDKAEATDSNIQRILGQLAEHELNPVEWGGETEVVRTSAIKETGIQDLLDILDYQSQLLDLKADYAGNAQGSVIEAQLEEGRGAVASILVQHGNLKKGDFIVVGRAFGRVRDIVNDHGKRITEAGPATPVAISGIDMVPDAGDKFYVVDSLRDAENAANERRDIERQRELATPRVTLDNIFSKLEEGQKKELRLIVKADVQGSVETLRKTLSELGNDEVRINVLHTAVGGINDSDITLAEASEAIIIGFNVTSTGKARQAAEAKGIDIRLYDVIYDITDDVKKALSGLLEPEHKLEVLGHAEVRQVFKVTKVGMVAGCYVTDGTIERNAQIRVTRDGIVIEKDRRLEQLKRFKDDAKEVRAGQECGMKIDGYDDIKEGDILECYKTIEVRREL